MHSEEEEDMNLRGLSWSPHCLWSFTNLYELWAFGYRWDDMACFFDSIPVMLRPLLLNALSLLEDNLSYRISVMKEVHAQCDVHGDPDSADK